MEMAVATPAPHRKATTSVGSGSGSQRSIQKTTVSTSPRGISARAIAVNSTEESDADWEAIQMTTIMRTAPKRARTRRTTRSTIPRSECGPGWVQDGADC